MEITRCSWVVVCLALGCGPSAGPDGTIVGSGDGETGGCAEPAPVCDRIPGDCSDAPPDAICDDGEWACPRAGFVVPLAACSESGPGEEGEGEGTLDGPAPGCVPDDLPPDCWDQGPGECSDAALPATCDGTGWVCPPGFGLGGFGEACEWPSPEGATLEDGGTVETTTTGDSGSSSTGDESSSTGQIDDGIGSAG